MRIIADLHIHTGFSRATSKDMTLPNLAHWAGLKGISLIGTGDFTHPEHFANIEELLTSDGNGLFVLKEQADDPEAVRFMLTTEVSNIYSTPDPSTKTGKRTRKIHSLIFAPTLEAVRKMNDKFDALGNIHSDGRPIFGFSAQDLIKIVLDSSPDAMLVPAHAWTPWFSIFGSKSGFDEIEECFGDYTKHIHAIETGLSSNPEMNSRLSALDNITLISNSDAHSLRKLGREANVFEAEMDYYEIMDIIKTKDRERFLYTVEFYPEEGKYHGDGHRACGVSFAPEETREAEGICPKCKKPLTVGVLYRVMELADRKPLADRAPDDTPKNTIPSRALVPLEEIISIVLGKGTSTKTVQKEYMRLVKEGGSEFNILLEAPMKELATLCSDRLTEAIIRVREGNISITPGFDGEFGKIQIFENVEEEDPAAKKQMGLF